MRRFRKHDEAIQGRRPSGSVTLEFVIAFPIVFITTLAIAQFFFLALVIEGATTALNEGVRQGAEAYPDTFPLDSAGVDDDIADKIVSLMNEHLGVYGVQIGEAAHDATIAIRHSHFPSAGTGGTVTRGLGTCEIPVSAQTVTNEIVITLCFNLTDGADGGPVPNWLANFGFDLAGTTFEMTSRASLE